MKRILLIFIFLMISSQSHAVSYNCDKASNAAEHAVCESVKLRYLDDQISYLYKKSKEQYSNKKRLKNKQLQWITERNNCKSNMECLERVYNSRISTFKKKLYNTMPVNFPVVSKSIDKFVPNGWHLQYLSEVSRNYFVVVQRNNININSDKNRFFYILEKGADEDDFMKVVVSTPFLLEDPSGFGRYGDTFVSIYPTTGEEFDIVFYNGTNWNSGFEFTFGKLAASEMQVNDARNPNTWRLKKGVGYRTVELLGQKKEFFRIKSGIPLNEFRWNAMVEVNNHMLSASELSQQFKYIDEFD